MLSEPLYILFSVSFPLCVVLTVCACCRVVDDRYKLEKCIHIAMLYLQVRQPCDACLQLMPTSNGGALLLRLPLLL